MSTRFGDRVEDWVFGFMVGCLIVAALVWVVGNASIMHDQHACRRANPDYEQTGACK